MSHRGQSLGGEGGGGGGGDGGAGGGKRGDSDSRLDAPIAACTVSLTILWPTSFRWIPSQLNAAEATPRRLPPHQLGRL